MMHPARWIIVSGIQPDVGSERLAFDVACELSARHRVLFWDTASEVITSGKSLRQLLPYQTIFSPDLLRSFLNHEGTSLGVLQGPFDVDPSALADGFDLLQKSFDFVIAASRPTWDAPFLRLMALACRLLLVAPSGPPLTPEISKHMEELAKHQFPKALGRMISNPGQGRTLATQLENDMEVSNEPHILHADATQQAKNRIHQRLLESTSSESQMPAEKTQAVLEKLIAEEDTLPRSREVRGRMLSELLDNVLGLGPLEPLLKDPEIAEIMVNGTQAVFVEKKGRLYATPIHFENETQLRTVIDRIVAPIGRRVDESSPLCDARLADGSRVNIVLPPLALDGPALTIRKFMEKRLGLDDLVQFGALDSQMAQFLARCVEGRKNIIISGGTGSGKTTLLNILSGFISPGERIVTLEDAAELKLQQPHVVRLESRPANAEGQGAIAIRRLLVNALRMRPDRIVVGECRGGEALDMLQAMNTGHDGSLTTIHANSPRDALGRLEALVLMAGIDLPIRVIREQIRSAVHCIIQITRLPDGSRKIISITELTGMEGDVLTTAELFRYRGGHFETTGLVSQQLRNEPLE